MRRYDYSESRCDDARCGELVPSRGGDWVEADDAERAVAYAVRNAHRQVIAALYWHAGVGLDAMRREALALYVAAQILEAACKDGGQ